MKGSEFFRSLRERFASLRKPDRKIVEVQESPKSMLDEGAILHPIPEKRLTEEEALIGWVHILSTFWEKPSSIDEFRSGNKPDKSLAFDIQNGLTPGTTEIWNALTMGQMISVDPELIYLFSQEISFRQNKEVKTIYRKTLDEIGTELERQGKIDNTFRVLSKAQEIAKLPRSQQLEEIKKHLIEFQWMRTIEPESVLFPKDYDPNSKDYARDNDVVTDLVPGTMPIFYLLTIYELLLIDSDLKRIIELRGLIFQKSKFEDSKGIKEIYEIMRERVHQVRDKGLLTDLDSLLRKAQKIAKLSPDQRGEKVKEHLAEFKEKQSLA